MKCPIRILSIFILIITTMTMAAQPGRGELQKRRLKGLLAAMEDSNRQLREMALAQICKDYDKLSLKGDETAALESFLKDKEELNRVKAALILARSGHFELINTADFIQILEKRELSIELNRLLIELITGLPLSKSELDRLEALLEGSDSEQRYRALLTLGGRFPLEESRFERIFTIITTDKEIFRRISLERNFKRQNLFKGVKESHIPKLLKLFELEVDGESYSWIVDAIWGMNLDSKIKVKTLDLLKESETDSVKLALYRAGYYNSTTEVIKGLKESDPLIKAAALRNAAHFKLGADFAFPYILDLLQKGDYTLLNDALYALSHCRNLSKKELSRIVKLISHENIYIADNAMKALAKIRDLDYRYLSILEMIAAHKSDERRVGAINALKELEKAPQSTIKLLGEIVRDGNEELKLRNLAMESLAYLGELRASDLDEETLNAYLKLFSITPARAPGERFKNLLLQTVEEGNYGSRVNALLELSRQELFEPAILERVIKQLYLPELPAILRERIIVYLMSMERLEESALILKLINCSYLYPDEAHLYRFIVYYLTGGDGWAREALRWSVPRRDLPAGPSYEEALSTLELFARLWDESGELPQYRADLESKIAILITKKGIKWQKRDIPLIKEFQTRLEEADSTRSAALEMEISRLNNSLLYYLFNFLKLWGVHLLFWILLIFIYPYSPQVQAIFFWNPYLRKILGLGYVNFALTWIPFLRRKLFQPFKGALLADAMLDRFNRESYYKGLYIDDGSGEERFPLMERLPYLKGQVILEGESGLGKSMYLKYLLLNSRRLAVYLPASRCSQGVIEAIRSKLHGSTGDPVFLKSLIYSGALDIYIDGLNEVDAAAREKITAFVESNFSGNIIISTQPLEWKGPANVPVYTLLPLKEEQILDFLLAKERSLPESVKLKGKAYEEACRSYLEKLPQRPDRLKVYLKTLSNPMDLSSAALVIAQGEDPDLLQLQEQHYLIMSSDYKSKNMGSKFPLSSFSEHVYKMRIENRKRLEAESFTNELRCMERHRMVLKREEEYYFRHDKVMDYFIVRRFLEEGSLPEKHLKDSRFRGVYYLLAALLPYEEAMQLREKLLLHAVASKEHILSDSFIKLLQERGDEAPSFEEI